MLNSILAVKNELSDENLLNNNYTNVENEINTKISENEFNHEVIKKLNNEKEIYKSFYNNLCAIQQKITEFTKVETKQESTLKVLNEEEIELTK